MNDSSKENIAHSIILCVVAIVLILTISQCEINIEDSRIRSNEIEMFYTCLEKNKDKELCTLPNSRLEEFKAND